MSLNCETKLVPQEAGLEETLVDALLAEQRKLSAVDRFSQHHAPGERRTRERRYRSLLPATSPGPGQQFAFEVDLDKCSGCKACVTACHSLNGLDESETWRTVGLLTSERSTSQPALQHVTASCHHCGDPGCLNGCPVLAYHKDSVTGIVSHLDDQCIGCSYCVMKCPYDVPKYSKDLGIVRKCDMCSDRLAVGEAPACAQACPNEAIKITLVASQELTAQAGDAAVARFVQGHLPDFPDPSITRPTTRYLTRRARIAGMQAADALQLRPAPAHPPLSLMLVLTQLGVGATGAAVVLDPRSALLAWLALGATVAGIIAGTLHLGQPLKAWRGFLGWKRSWLSRELLAFGGAIGAMGAHAVRLQPETAWLALFTGLAALLCSGMIYADTQRVFWAARFTLPRFALTTLLLGAASAWVWGAAGANVHSAGVAATALLAAVCLKLGAELGFVMRQLPDRVDSDEDQEPSTWSVPSAANRIALRRSALLHTCVFRGWFSARFALGGLGGMLLPGLGGLGVAGLPLAITALVICAAGELIERHLFFVCEAAPRMPGGLAR